MLLKGEAVWLPTVLLQFAAVVFTYLHTSVIVAGRHLIGTRLRMTCQIYSPSQVHHAMTTMDTVMSFRSAERYGKFRVKIISGNYEYNHKSFSYL